MLDAVEWGDHDCPDCDKSFATAQEARWHQRYHCDGEAGDDGQVWIGAGHSNPGADHDLNLAVQNADPEEVFE